MKSIHIVCVGNINRSPLLEEILRTKAKNLSLFDLQFSSSGISEYHAGKTADPRMIQAAKEKGYSLQDHIAKKFSIESFAENDLILAATKDVLEELVYLREVSSGKAKLLLATSFSPKFCDIDIPDPYHSGERGFSAVIDICEDAADGLLKWLAKKD
jgi:protein-tyrosine phosphatase